MDIAMDSSSLGEKNLDRCGREKLKKTLLKRLRETLLTNSPFDLKVKLKTYRENSVEDRKN